MNNVTNFETSKINGRTLIIRHTFPLGEIKVGSRWAPADGCDREVEIIDIKNDEIVYLDGKNKLERDYFSFQCRYCLIVSDGEE